MKIIKIILSVIIFLALIAMGYIYTEITNVTYDWLGEGKTLSILCFSTLSFFLIRFGLKAGSKLNVIHILMALITILASTFLIQNTSVLVDYWILGVFLFLTQGTFALWGRLDLNNVSLTQKLLFLSGPILVGLCLLTGWFSGFAGVFIGLALLLTTVISIKSLFQNRTS